MVQCEATVKALMATRRMHGSVTRRACSRYGPVAVDLAPKAYEGKHARTHKSPVSPGTAQKAANTGILGARLH